MKKETLWKYFKITSIAGIPALCVLDLVICGKTYSLTNVIAVLLFADNLLLLLPTDKQSLPVSLCIGVFTLLTNLAASVFQLAAPDVAGIEFRLFLPIVAVLLTTQVDGALKTLGKYKNIRTLFKSAQVLSNIEDQALFQRTLQL